MARSRIDNSVQRKEVDGFQFPLGVYPIVDMEPRTGYTVDFEPADGGGAASDWEEWPDRYMFDIVAPANRLRSLCRAFFSLLPSRVYPILDILGEDAYREVDPYIAYDSVPFDRFIHLVHQHKDWLYEDGLVGFGAMSEEPFLYVYVDEHKIVTVRAQADMRDKVERILEAFEIGPIDTLSGADAAAHEHRSVLSSNPGSPLEEEILEELLEAWRLQLNIDRDTNVDDAGRELGITCWRCMVRMHAREDEQPVYGQVWLRASSLEDAESLTFDAFAEATSINLDSGQASAMIVLADRVTTDAFNKALAEMGLPPCDEKSNTIGVLAVRLLEDEDQDAS